MRFARWDRLPVLGVGLLVLACGGGGGGGGGTGPPGPPTQLAKSGGDGQSWYFNNPLPMPYSVTARDANNRTVPSVSVDWAITTGGGTLSTDPSTTNSSGDATTVHALGSASTYVVTATVTGLPSVTFSAGASAPPTSAAVSVRDNFFSPSSVAIQTGGTVTWTWAGAGAEVHNVTISGPTPRPPDAPNRTTGTHQGTFTTVGTYNYTCTNHVGMNGSVTVVN